MSDEELLRDYAQNRNEAAFAALVGRHLNLVYSVARRHVHSASLAEDVAQSVFIDLARQARQLKADTPVVAWLHLVSRRTAIDTVRHDARRRLREQHAAEIADHDRAESSAMKTPDGDWPGIEPLLDEAVESLEASDRAAILLRYFENRSLRDVGAALGISDDTAQKRVSRAIERLRTFFLRRGIGVSAAGLATNLSAHALHFAPATLGGSILSATAVALSSTATAATTTLTMTTLQKTVLFGAFVAVGGAGLYEAGVLRAQDSALRATQEKRVALHAEIRELRASRTASERRLAGVEKQIDARLPPSTPTLSTLDVAMESQAKEWLGQLARIREALQQKPELNIPELQLLAEDDWFNAAAVGRFESDDDVRRATSSLRNRAENRAAMRLAKALTAYLAAHADLLPKHPDELAPYCEPPFDPAILKRYEMLKTGKAADIPRLERAAMIAPKQPADVELDAYWTTGAGGYGGGSAMDHNVREAQRKFAEAHAGAPAPNATQLLPYLKWPAPLTAVEKTLRPTASR